MDYVQQAEQCIRIADKKLLSEGERATVAALESITFALLHLAETVARLEQ